MNKSFIQRERAGRKLLSGELGTVQMCFHVHLGVLTLAKFAGRVLPDVHFLTSRREATFEALQNPASCRIEILPLR